MPTPFGPIDIPDEEMRIIAELWDFDGEAFAQFQWAKLREEIERRVREREAAKAQAGIATAVEETQAQLPSLFPSEGG